MIHTALESIKTWLQQQAPQVLAHLNGPASEAELAQVEAATGLSLPEDLKTFLRLHNGEDGETWLALLGNGNQLLSCEQIIQQYKLAKKSSGGLAGFLNADMDTVPFWKDRAASEVIFIKGSVKPLIRHPRWLPITCMNGDVFRYLDFDPAPGGSPGQVIEVDLEGCMYQVLAPSFGALLAQHAADLQNNLFSVDPEGYLEADTSADVMSWGVPDWLKNA